MKKRLSTELTKANISQVMSLLADTPGKLDTLSQHFAAGKLPPSPAQRSFTENVAHLLNYEARSAEAIYLALLLNNPPLPDIHPERQWGKLLGYQLMSCPDLLAYFKFRRTVLLRVLATLDEAQWARTSNESGKKRQESVYWRARSLVIHEVEHLADLQGQIIP